MPFAKRLENKGKEEVKTDPSGEQEDIMKSPRRWPGNIPAVVRRVVVLAIALIVVGAWLTPALARDGWHHGRGWHHGHGRYYWHGRYYYYPPPGYSPPPAYYPPPPVAYAPTPPPPGITFVFPLRIR